MEPHFNTHPTIDAAIMALLESSAKRWIDNVLGALLAFSALFACLGGYYSAKGVKDIPEEWLKGSPYPEYLLPSLILVVIIGGSSFVASVAVFTSSPNSRFLAFFAGALLVSWILTQLATIGYAFWMQLFFFLLGVVIILLAWILPKRG